VFTYAKLLVISSVFSLLIFMLSFFYKDVARQVVDPKYEQAVQRTASSWPSAWTRLLLKKTRKKIQNNLKEALRDYKLSAHAGKNKRVQGMAFLRIGQINFDSLKKYKPANCITTARWGRYQKISKTLKR